MHSGRAYNLLQSMTVAALKSELASSSWADAPSLPDDACTDTWVLVRRTVLQGDPRRPVVSGASGNVTHLDLARPRMVS